MSTASTAVSKSLAKDAQRQKQVLLSLTYLSETFAVEGAEQITGLISGKSLRIVARTEPDGRPSIVVKLRSRVHRMRASGKSYHYWRTEQLITIFRTQQDLLVLREQKNAVQTFSRHVFTADAWASEITTMVARLRQMAPDHQLEAVEGPALEPRRLLDELTQVAIAEAVTHLGSVTTAQQRFPLWPDFENAVPRPSAELYGPFLDAENYAQVAKNLFGVRAYRKPLAGFAERVDPQTLSWFRLFRGLVPIDWIIDALHAYEAEIAKVTIEMGVDAAPNTVLTYRQERRLERLRAPLLPSHTRRALRQLLRQLPQPLLRRILRDRVGVTAMSLRDTAAALQSKIGPVRDVSRVAHLIERRGQRNLRTARDLEQLVWAMPTLEQRPTRQDTAIALMVDEQEQHWAMQDYNTQIARLPDAGRQVATWDVWRDAAFRREADAFLQSHRRELQTAAERDREARAEQARLERLAREARRHAWALTTMDTLDGLVVSDAPKLTLAVARNADTLRSWGLEMHHCIGNYSHVLDLDVFVAVQDEQGRSKVALQISQDDGIRQMLGKRNRDTIEALGAQAQPVLDQLVAHGIQVHADTLGLEGLRVPELLAA